MLKNLSSATEPLLEAIKMGQKEVAQMKLVGGEYSDLDYQNDSADGTPLYWAAAKGFEDLVRFLLLLGASVDATTGWGATALHAAADNDQDIVIDTLLANGADVDVRTSRGDTPCHLAAYRGSLKATRRLVQGGTNIRTKNDQGNDVMREAMQNRRYEIVKYLWSLIKSDYKTPTEDLKSIIPEATVAEGNYRAIFSSPMPQTQHSRGHHHQNQQKSRSELDRSQTVRRSSVPMNHFAVGQQQTYPPPPQRLTYPPTTWHCRGFPVPQEPVFVRGQEMPYACTSGMVGARPRQLDLPVRYFSSTALHCQSPASTPTPSEDEVDWNTSLCVDEDKFKSRLWGKEQ